MTATRILGIAEICHAFRGGIADVSGPEAYENFLAMMEGRASLYLVSGPGTRLVMLVSMANGQLWLNAIAGRVAPVFEAKGLITTLATMESSTAIRGRTTNERLRVLYRRLGAVELSPGDFQFDVKGK